MRRFMCYGDRFPKDVNCLYVQAVNPVRAAELYGSHLAKAKVVESETVNVVRFRIGVMEVCDIEGEGVGIAMHSEGDLFYEATARRGQDEVTVLFDEHASQYSSDGDTETGDWHR